MFNSKIVAGALAAFLAVSGAVASAQTPSPYKIGLTLPLSGPLANSGQDYLPGAESRSPGSTPPAASTAIRCDCSPKIRWARRPAASPPCASSCKSTAFKPIMTFYTNVVSAQIPLAEELKVPIIGAIQTPGLMSRSPYTFSHAETLTHTAGLFGDYWKNHKMKRVYAFIPNNALGGDLFQLVQSRFGNGRRRVRRGHVQLRRDGLSRHRRARQGLQSRRRDRRVARRTRRHRPHSPGARSRYQLRRSFCPERSSTSRAGKPASATTWKA